MRNISRKLSGKFGAQFVSGCTNLTYFSSTSATLCGCSDGYCLLMLYDFVLWVLIILFRICKNCELFLCFVEFSISFTVDCKDYVFSLKSLLWFLFSSDWISEGNISVYMWNDGTFPQTHEDGCTDWNAINELILQAWVRQCSGVLHISVQMAISLCFLILNNKLINWQHMWLALVAPIDVSCSC